ncbi:MAG: T9SS type A sorting domain-containing protein [Aquaticitalea sp.]
MKTQLHIKIFVFSLFLFLADSTFSQCWQSVSAGKRHTIALHSNGSLWAWGSNTYGLGNGTTFSDVPTQIGSVTDWLYISAGEYNNLAIKSDGSLWGWGYNWFGHLGDGTNTDKSTPIRIGTDTDWKWVSAGYRHTVAIKNDGTLWTWGSNISGALGNGGTNNSFVPINIETLNDNTTWKMAVAGHIFTLAIKLDGTLWGWGANSAGQLGDGTEEQRSIPIKIGIDTNWNTIVVGYQHTVALKTDGTLWAWGANIFGQLGDGTNEDVSIPSQIGSDTDWENIAVGSRHTLAIKNDGTLWAWGLNASGSLGDNTTIDKNVPTQIGTDINWQFVNAGELQSKAIKTNGNLWAWGPNNFGQTGNGSPGGNITAPVSINCATLGTDAKNLKRNQYSIFPNPTSNILTIENPFSGNIQLRVINQLGQMVVEQQQITERGSLDVTALSKGLYLLSITSEDGKSQTIKFIKN